jgi:competence protein ComEA
MSEQWDRWRNWLAGVVIVGALGAALGLVYPLLQRPAAPPVQLVVPAPSVTPVTEVLVHVAGPVVQPGLYALPAGSRVGQAIEAAGGPTEEANLDALNLAARLQDGQRLAVPRADGSALTPDPPPTSADRASPAAGRDGARLNLNAATVAQLDALPGIGPSYARRIVEHRDRNGPFRDLQQFRDARLIPAATFERIRERLTAE